MYVRLFASLLDSTIWCEDSDTRVTWITMLLMADREGFLFATVPGLAKRASVTIESVNRSLDKFLGPDAYSADKSRDAGGDGRRLECVEGGWRILNYSYYRNLMVAEARRPTSASRSKKYRSRKKRDASREKRDESRPVTLRHTANAISDAESYSDADTAIDQKNPPAAPAVPHSSTRSWHGVKGSTVPVLRMLDRRLRERDAALALPDDIGVEMTKALNVAMVKLPADTSPERVRYAVYWASSDPWYADKVRDVNTLVSNIRGIISGSADTWKALKEDLSFLDEGVFP